MNEDEELRMEMRSADMLGKLIAERGRGGMNEHGWAWVGDEIAELAKIISDHGGATPKMLALIISEAGYHKSEGGAA